MVIMQGQAQLFQLVRALHPPRGFPRRLDGRQEQRHQDPDHSDYDQQLDKSKAAYDSLVPWVNTWTHRNYLPSIKKKTKNGLNLSSTVATDFARLAARVREAGQDTH
jgi:hypothetical protein